MFPSDVDFETKITLETEAVTLNEELPFHILLLGDWSGSEGRVSTAPELNLSPIEIDRDNFSDVMRKLNIVLGLKFQGNSEDTLSLKFEEFDDFHPDKIFQRLSLFAELRGIRQKLMRADTFDEAAKEVRSWMVKNGNIEAEQPGEKAISSEDKPIVPNNLLDEILGAVNSDVSETKTKNVEISRLSAFVAGLVKPHIIQTDSADQSNLLMIVDEVISDLMRKILHHPQFQALESAWRGVYFLVRKIETNSFLKLFLFDISKAKLAADLKSANDLSDSEICRMLADETTEPWAVICGNYTFGLNIDDVATLIRLAKIGSASNTPFISYVKPEMFSFDSFASDSTFDGWQTTENSTKEKLWETLRSTPDCNYLGLALPRFLARLPYGEQTDPTESFYFEELTSSVEHNQYLWANPSFVCAFLFARNFQQFGWDLISNFSRDVDDFPMHLYEDAGETKIKPCAEVLLSENNCEKLSNEGLIPLISFRDTGKIRLGRLRSVRYPLSDLCGRWS